MTSINRLKHITSATLFAMATALAAPAHALDVQIQEGAAVKFPKGLKWEPMAKTVVSHPRMEWDEKTQLLAGTATPQERKTTIALWQDKIHKNLGDAGVELLLKQIKTQGGVYMVSGMYTHSTCWSSATGNPVGNKCVTQIRFVPDNAPPSSAAALTACMYSGMPRKAQDLYGEDDVFFDKNRPEVAFDSKNKTIYMRNLEDGKTVQSCNRKIVLK